MDSLSAFARGQASKDQPVMVFDWDKAATILRDRSAKEASAGLRGDWEWTGGVILRDGKPVPADDTYVYLASTWAVPELEVDDEIIDCYRRKEDTPDWDSGTYWPESARAIFASAESQAADSKGSE